VAAPSSRAAAAQGRPVEGWGQAAAAAVPTGARAREAARMVATTAARAAEATPAATEATATDVPIRSEQIRIGWKLRMLLG
jgi:hypothetical protein